MNNRLFYILIFGIFYSCSKPKSEVGGIPSEIHLSEDARIMGKELCDCFLEDQSDGENLFSLILIDFNSIEEDLELKKCIRTKFQKNKELIENLNEEERNRFLKDLIHALIQSTCTEKIMQSIPDFIVDQILESDFQ